MAVGNLTKVAPTSYLKTAFSKRFSLSRDNFVGRKLVVNEKGDIHIKKTTKNNA